MEISAGVCQLRPYAADDRERLAQIADDRRIWINTSDRFPHPYSEDDADEWIRLCADAGDPPHHLAIDHEDRLVGGIGVDIGDRDQRDVGTVGYWLTPSHWNLGIATASLSAMIPYAFETFALRRLRATVLGWNPASGKVLGKCGFSLEGRQPDAVVKDGKVTDQLLYGLRADLPRDPAAR